MDAEFDGGQTSGAGAVPYELYILLAPLAEHWLADSDWPRQLVAACAFQAGELTLRLVDDALDDRRPVASVGERSDRLVRVLLAGFDAASALMARSSLPPRLACGAGPAGARRGEGSGGAGGVSPGFRIVRRLAAGHVREVTDSFHAAFSPLPFRIGVERELDAARGRVGLARLAWPAGPTMDYRRVVSPAEVFALRASEPCGPEDHLFSTVHQITECWLRIVHHLLDEACRDAESDHVTEAAHSLDGAARALVMATEVGQLLDLLVPSDYHPLRVRLRDASGAQSAAARGIPARARAALAPLLRTLERRRSSLVDLLDRPAEHPDLYRYLCAAKRFAKHYQSFLFHHYLLVLHVLGTQSLGSLGYRVQGLAEHAAAPLFPELNRAHHDYAVVTGFRHGRAAGELVLRKELERGEDPYAVAHDLHDCPPELITSQVDRYFRLIQDHDAEGWVGLFEPARGQFRDSPGSRPYLGRRRLRVFIDTIFATFPVMRTSYREKRRDGNHVEVGWRFDAASYDGRPVVFSGTERFFFADDGKIIEAVAVWRPEDVAGQLWPRPSAPPAVPET